MFLSVTPVNTLAHPSRLRWKAVFGLPLVSCLGMNRWEKITQHSGNCSSELNVGLCVYWFFKIRPVTLCAFLSILMGQHRVLPFSLLLPMILNSFPVGFCVNTLKGTPYNEELPPRPQIRHQPHPNTHFHRKILY